MPGRLDELDSVIDDHAIRPISPDPPLHTLEGALDMCGVISNYGASQDGLLPSVVKIHLCNGQVEFAPESRRERLDATPLFLERGTRGKMKMKGEYADHC